MSVERNKVEQTTAKKVAPQKELCAKISPEQARQRKLEAIERQLYHLIGQIRELKTT